VLEEFLLQCLFVAGWRTRWFVLEGGVLAYYNSKEEVNLGCKGSMKVSALEINGMSYILHHF